MAQDYGQSLNLPNTEFPMRANLPQREPEFLKEFEEFNLYQKLLEKNKDKELFILHDGPPFANGDIHTGHALNKILKDIIVKYKAMTGFKTPFVPGWDTHGLPIEQQAIKKLGINRFEQGPSSFRKVCKDFAQKYIDNQIVQFKRLGVIGDFDNPYITFDPEFEAKQIEVFGEIAKLGYIYKSLKPVYWCPDCVTALAEAEIEYADDKTNSIYVKFSVKDDLGKLSSLSIDKSKLFFVIWTTTTWTLPGNVAISVNPDFDYAIVKANDEYLVIAKELVETVMSKVEIDNYEIIAVLKGAELEYIKCAHPFLDRDSIVITGDHVTLEAGTGCVHTAPGHGIEDFIVCRKYGDLLPIVVPVDDKGILNELAGEFSGMYYEKSNAKIIEKLTSTNNLLRVEKLEHSYPHCWRCKEPIIFRATEQWFASIDAFKEKAVEAIKTVEWVPVWGEDRITSMILDRSDWCISRQRIWGVPIPIFYCTACHEHIINDETITAVKTLFREKGSDAWYDLDASEILPKGFKCTCGNDAFTKETDIMDVWFDSGSSHSAVLETREGLRFPADMYLEGNDQYRGWFQSSLLTAVATKGKAPYKTVLTHGFVVDGEGKKMSKSLGNGIDPLDIVKEYGADILRLWVVSSDYKNDVRISKDILKQLSEIYRKIRNTSRFILGNISDFNPETDSVSYSEMDEIDKWALLKLNGLISKVKKAYDTYEFHILYHAIHNFCVVDMSNFYLDIIKDKLYTEKTASKTRRSSQTAMHRILTDLMKMLAPVLAITAEEVWRSFKHFKDEDLDNILFNDMPKVYKEYEASGLEEKWDKILEVRTEVSKALELARMNKIIGHSLNAKVMIYTGGEWLTFLKGIEQDLDRIFITSKAEVYDLSDCKDKDAYNAETIPELKIQITESEGAKCERCWIYSESVSTNKEHPTLCDRCVKAIN